MLSQDYCQLWTGLERGEACLSWRLRVVEPSSLILIILHDSTSQLCSRVSPVRRVSNIDLLKVLRDLKVRAGDQETGGWCWELVR